MCSSDLCWSAGGWDQGREVPKAGAGLLVGGLGPATVDHEAVVVPGLVSAHWLGGAESQSLQL